MKKFTSLRETLSYHNSCPLCNSTLKFNDRRAIINNDEIVFKKDEYIIKLDSNEIFTQLDSGKDTIGYYFQCIECVGFAYSIKIEIDNAKKLITDVSLNSESISISENRILYEIRNSYSLDRTEYSVFNFNLKIDDPNYERNISLPLMPMDVRNPSKIFNRIKKLIIFS